MSSSRRTTLTLTLEDRELILKHGYPFPKLQAALELVPSSEDLAVIACDHDDVESLLGDLARSINDCEDDDLQERLNELYESIEAEASTQAR